MSEIQNNQTESFVYKKSRLKFGVFVVWCYIIVQSLMMAFVATEPGESEVYVDSKGNERVRIVFWHAMGGTLGRTLDELVKKFNTTQEEIWVDAQNMGNYSALSQKLIASILSGTTPDCAQAYEAWISKFIQGKDVLVKLNDYIEKEQLNLDEFYPVMIDNVRYGDDIWALPFNKSFPLFYYNKEHMKRCGFNEDSFPQTLDEVYKLFMRAKPAFQKYFSDFGIPFDVTEKQSTTAYKITVDNILKDDPQLLVLAGYRLTKDFTDFEEPVKSDEDYEGIWNRVRSFVNDFRATDFNPGLAMFGNMYMQFGGELEVKDGNLKLDVKPAVDAISMMAQMFYKDGLATLTQAFDHQNNFVAGKLLAIQGSCVSKSFMETQIRFKWAMAPLPGGVKKAAIMQGTNVILFNNRSKKRSDASYKFISWFSKDENTAYWSRYTNYLPVRKNAGNEPVLKEYLQNESQIHPEALIKQMNDACFEPRDSAWFKSRDVLGQKLQDVMILIEKQVKSKNAYQNESVRELIEEEVNKINTQIGEIYQYYQ